MRTIIGILSILFGALFINITINQFEKIGNIMLTFYGITLCVLGANVLSNRKITNGKIYTSYRNRYCDDIIWSCVRIETR